MALGCEDDDVDFIEALGFFMQAGPLNAVIGIEGVG